MVLRIDERDLKAKLNERKSFIGYGSKGDGIANIIASLFYIPSRKQVARFTASPYRQYYCKLILYSNGM